MAEYDFTKLAQLDLEDIYDQIASMNVSAARKTLDSIEQRCEALAEMPKQGRQRNELFSNLRSVAEGNYIIFYKETDTGILVIRILHCKRDLDRFFDPAALPDELQ